MLIKLHIKRIPPNGFHVFIKGRIKGVPVDFLIDTGASKSLVDKSFAQKHFPHLRIKQTTHQTTGLGASIENSEFAKMDRINLGNFHLKPAELALLDLSVINTAYAEAGLKPVYAILGGDLLKKYHAIIDYHRRVIDLSI